MHHIIRIICYAKDEKQAREKAEEILIQLVEEEKRFDYGTFFDEDNKINGKGRWGNLPVVALADSKDGKRFIYQGMKAIKRDFKENITMIREFTKKFNDDELFEGIILDKNKQILSEIEDKEESTISHLTLNPFFFKHICWRMSKGDWLYNNDGEVIQTSENLKNALTKWKCVYEDCDKENPYKDEKVWVVPCDVHT